MTKKKKKKGSDNDIEMSVPEGMAFGVPYSLNSTGHSEYYYDFDRNRDNKPNFGERLDIEVKAITDLLKTKNIIKNVNVMENIVVIWPS